MNDEAVRARWVMMTYGHEGGFAFNEDQRGHSVTVFTAQDIVDFLRREDVLVGLGESAVAYHGQVLRQEVIVHHKFWKWEGCAENVIDAAVMAMRVESKVGSDG